jgi:hypothetical protein
MIKAYQTFKERLHEMDKVGPLIKYGVLLTGLTCWAAGGYLYYRAYSTLKPFKTEMAEYKLKAKSFISENLDGLVEQEEFCSQYSTAKYQAGALTTAGFSIGKVGTLLVIPSASLIYWRYKKSKKQKKEQNLINAA